MNHSEQLFDSAKQIIPGGVNSPVRAFNGVGVPHATMPKIQRT